VGKKEMQKVKTDMLRSIANSLCGVSLEEEKEGYSGKDLQKRKDLSLEKRA